MSLVRKPWSEWSREKKDAFGGASPQAAMYEGEDGMAIVDDAESGQKMVQVFYASLGPGETDDDVPLTFFVTDDEDGAQCAEFIIENLLGDDEE